MNRMLFLGIVCMAAGALFVASSAIPGVVVPECETARLMGSVCYRTTSPRYICYGANCMSGGCGCMKVYDEGIQDSGGLRNGASVNVQCKDSSLCRQTYSRLGTGGCGGEP